MHAALSPLLLCSVFSFFFLSSVWFPPTWVCTVLHSHAQAVTSLCSHSGVLTKGLPSVRVHTTVCSISAQNQQPWPLSFSYNVRKQELDLIGPTETQWKSLHTENHYSTFSWTEVSRPDRSVAVISRPSVTMLPTGAAFTVTGWVGRRWAVARGWAGCGRLHIVLRRRHHCENNKDNMCQV